MNLLALIAATLCISTLSGQPYQETGNDASWIKECQGNRLYIKADRLEITDKDIIVRDESNLPIKLSHISVDILGIFTTIDTLNAADIATVWNIVWCRTCEAYRSIDIRGNCVRCGNKP